MEGLQGQESLLTWRFQKVTEVRKCVSESESLKGGPDIVSNFDGKIAVGIPGYWQCCDDGMLAG